MTTRTIGLALALALAGCGSNGDEADSEATAGGEQHAEGEHGHGEHGHAHGEGEHAHGEGEHEHGGGHEHAMSDALRAFHDVLAPVYHMDPGAERAQATCGAAARMAELAPTVSEETTTAVGALGGACGEGELSADAVEGVEASLESVHDAFHHAMEAEQGAH